MGFPAVLFIVFLVLKLCGVIAWSWVWVTSPLWAGFAIWLVVVGFVLLFGLLVAALKRF